MSSRAVHGLPHRERLDGEPRRAVTAVNVRYEEKRIFDHLHSWWELRAGRSLSHWDSFSRVLALALEHPDVDAPLDLSKMRKKKRS